MAGIAQKCFLYTIVSRVNNESQICFFYPITKKDVCGGFNHQALKFDNLYRLTTDIIMEVIDS